MSHIISSLPTLSKDIPLDRELYNIIKYRYGGTILSSTQVEYFTYLLKLSKIDLEHKELIYDNLFVNNLKHRLFSIISQDKAGIKSISWVLNSHSLRIQAQVQGQKQTLSDTYTKTSEEHSYWISETLKNMNPIQFDIRRFNELRHDKNKAMEYLLSCGIRWMHSDHEGINWMRAVMSVNAISNIY